MTEVEVGVAFPAGLEKVPEALEEWLKFRLEWPGQHYTPTAPVSLNRMPVGPGDRVSGVAEYAIEHPTTFHRYRLFRGGEEIRLQRGQILPLDLGKGDKCTVTLTLCFEQAPEGYPQGLMP